MCYFPLIVEVLFFSKQQAYFLMTDCESLGSGITAFRLSQVMGADTTADIRATMTALNCIHTLQFMILSLLCMFNAFLSFFFRVLV